MRVTRILTVRDDVVSEQDGALWRRCKSCEYRGPICDDYPQQEFGAPERYCPTCREARVARRLVEALQAYGRGIGRPIKRVLIVLPRK